MADDQAERTDGWPAETLRAIRIFRSFEGVTALHDVSLELARHEVVGLIGPNGAGKTTLVNIITGFDSPDTGMVRLEGRDVTTWTPHRRGRDGLARTFQGAHSFSSLSTRENVEVAALGSGATSREARLRADRLLRLLGLVDLESAPAAFLPHGHERKLGVARALGTEPRFVLMDEPAAGLNELEVEDFATTIREVRDEHEVGVLLIDHNITLILRVCDRIHVLDQGKTIAEGAPSEIRGNVDVATAYLGTSMEGGDDDG
ncbi:MAG: ABC transporter ATP-binding protein [Acidimicrobiia bacterium]